MKITIMLVKFIPIATFTSVLSLVLKTGADVLVSMLAMLGTFLVGLLVMLVVYCLLILVIGHLNPLIFLKKYGPTVLQVFGMLLSLFLSVLILSIGAPGVPGSGLICLSVILTQLNIPVAGIGLVMGLDSLLGMIRAVGNSMADVVGSLLVTRTEKILNLDIYMKK